MYAVLSKRCFKPRFRGGIRSVRRVQFEADGVLCKVGRIVRAVGVHVVEVYNKGPLWRFYKNCLGIGDVLDESRRL